MGVAYEREAGGAHVAEAYGQNGRRARGRRFCSKGICHYEKRLPVYCTGNAVFQHDGNRAQGSCRTV